jgi:ABC-type transport system substrate-binding protein
VEWIPGDSLTVERFDDYWRKGFPYLDKIVVKPILNSDTRISNLQSRAIDLLMNVSLAEKATLSTRDMRDEGIVVGAEPPGFSFFGFIMNINAPPFDNQLVRQAFNYAIDRQGIVDQAFYGQAISTTLPYPKTSWAYAADLADRYPYSPEKAKELLAAAGYPAGFSIKMLVRGTDGPHLAQAQVYQKQLTAVGIHAQLIPADDDDYWPQLYAGNFSIVSHSTVNQSVDPGGLFEAAACCRPFNSFFGLEYTQEELQKPPDQRTDRSDTWFAEYRDTINQAREESDRQTRQGLYHQVMQILLDQGWMIPTVWNQTAYAHWNDVHNVRMDPDGNIWLGESWLNR